MSNSENSSLEPTSSFSKFSNILVAIAAVCLGTLLFFSTRQSQSQVSLEALAQRSTAYEQAIANPKPTLIEFYADWCTSCQSMAADNLALQQEYGDRLNFVMLNVDNTKWLPEMERFQVDGIPHFVYLDRQNQVLGNAIGVIPKQILASNLDAMIAQSPLPHLESSSRTSPLPAPTIPKQPQPTSHGNPI
ncbi:MAG: thioredoxin family protein [Pseudanabaenaceae cyanobacterium bins.68]|nr:thioredoxin family protein [Pseudanabaenaceae cyanobacterium bins.68]